MLLKKIKVILKLDNIIKVEINIIMNIGLIIMIVVLLV